MKFTEFPYGSNNQIANPECGKKKASEVHFYINVIKYPDENDLDTDLVTELDTADTDQTNSIDLVSIKLGDKFKLVLGMKHVKIFKVESENEERIIFKVSISCSRDSATNSETANPGFFSRHVLLFSFDLVKAVLAKK